MPEEHSPRSSALAERVYDQLRAIAQRRMAEERSDHTLQATALVHEAYLRISSSSEAAELSKAEFVQMAAGAMRHILIDHARGKARVKRGGGRPALPLDVVDLATQSDSSEILALDDAIRRLRARDPRAASQRRLR